MKLELTDPYSITPYTRHQGYFIVVKQDNSVANHYGCREDFANAHVCFNFYRRVGFREDGVVARMKAINHFWNQIFAKLGEKSKFEICETNIPDLVAVDLPDFWLKNDTVRSLFTLLFRCSCHFHKDGEDFTKSLQRYELSSPVIPAIQHFLEGNIEPTYSQLTRTERYGHVGFVAEFDRLTAEQIASKLVKPTVITSKY